MKKWIWIVVSVIAIIAIAFVALNVFNKGGSGSGFDLGSVDYSAGSGFKDSIKDSTKSNAFDEVETNPFRYENG